MTATQFDYMNWKCGLKAKHKNYDRFFDVASVDFEERTVGLAGFTEGTDDIHWARCENIDNVIDKIPSHKLPNANKDNLL